MDADKIKNSVQAVIDGLTPLAQKMQVPIEGLWKWAMLHNYAIAGSEIGAWLFSLLLLIPLWKLIKYGNGKDEGKFYTRFYDSDGLMVAGILLSITLGILVIVLSCIVFSDAFMRIIAPQWSTIQDISNLIHGQ